MEEDFLYKTHYLWQLNFKISIMKRIIIISSFLLFSYSIFGQLFLNPELSVVYLQQNGICGPKISNNFIIKKENKYFEIGLDFIKARGNKNIDLNKYSRYTFEYIGYAPPFNIPLSGPSFWGSFPIGLKPLTSTTRQYNIKVGFFKIFNFNKSSLNIGGGLYGSYVDTYYFIGTYGNTSISFPYFANSELFDLVYPVSLRYINLGFYTGFSYKFLPEKKYPLILNFQYYYGRYHSGFWSLGVSVPLKFNAVDSKVVKE